MNDDFFGQDDYEDHPPKGRDNLFLWTVAILLLVGVALTTWLGSYYVFGHPEKPESYRILQKLKKLDPPKRYELTKAPAGEFLTPQRAYERYAKMSNFELQRENEALIRDYIRNYQSTKRLVPYLTGRFTIMNSYELKESDYFGSGVVAVAQSVDFPQTVIEHVYTAGPAAVPILEQMLSTGLDIKLERMSDLAAVVHIERLHDGRLQFSVVPLLYGSYSLMQGSGSFSLEPPAVLNPSGGLPIVRGQLLDESLRTFASFMRERTQGLGEDGQPKAPVALKPGETTIVRVATPPPSKKQTEEIPGESEAEAPPAETTSQEPAIVEATPAPTPIPEPEPAVATAAPTPAPTPEIREIPEAQPTPAVAATPVATPPPLAAATPAKPPLQPFLAAAQTPAPPPAGGGNWKTYNPGQMPRGRLITLGDASDLAQRGTGGERLYLRGNFVVTASGGSRAVLRSNSAFGGAINTLTRQAPTRVIVEFPAGQRPPAEQSNVSRDEMRPFEVREIRRGKDGQINVYVREITAP